MTYTASGNINYQFIINDGNLTYTITAETSCPFKESRLLSYRLHDLIARIISENLTSDDIAKFQRINTKHGLRKMEIRREYSQVIFPGDDFDEKIKLLQDKLTQKD